MKNQPSAFRKGRSPSGGEIPGTVMFARKSRENYGTEGAVPAGRRGQSGRAHGVMRFLAANFAWQGCHAKSVRATQPKQRPRTGVSEPHSLKAKALGQECPSHTTKAKASDRSVRATQPKQEPRTRMSEPHEQSKSLGQECPSHTTEARASDKNVRATRANYVPSDQPARYSSCSGVRRSILMPMDSSFSLATRLSSSSGTR